MERNTVPYAATGRSKPIVLDHLSGDPAMAPFSTFPFSEVGIAAAVDARTFDPGVRTIVSRALEGQYAGPEMHPAVRASLDRFRDPRALTITTGHQLCLFGGPRYVLYKVLNAIRLARQFDRQDRPVVPVFWMASEDHDLPEVDHVFLRNERVHWTATAGGAVGRMPLVGIAGAVRKASDLLGMGPGADTLRVLLQEAYRPEHTLAQATRRFLHGLFGRLGLVVIDGDDPALKRLFAPVMREELLNQVVERTVRYADEKLPKGYGGQAHARPVNLFHLRPGHRSRVSVDDAGYHVLDGGPGFSSEELLAEVERAPQDFSPNVLLRPLYQETILPNVAYVGGGGEVAYWMQLRWTFQALQVPMPVVALRTSALLLEAEESAKLAQLGLHIEDLFMPVDQLGAEWARTHASVDTSLAAERERIGAVFQGIVARSAGVDPTLEASAKGEQARMNKRLDHLEERLLRAAKRREAVNIARLERIHALLFPGGGLRERREGLLTAVADHGVGLLDGLLDALDPLEKRFTVLSFGEKVSG
ncbi:MAG: bacillithiol biosynthesis cysteine-adding enzyme BshC [Flavobacteriales bacterium]|nr:bacillithiol biosynthesis cysteine-adding enzyme BshC [Flavobacteriales bacterium]MCB9194049.1 bacillithiol biosynthesis cysteine-adding enzyme BshC [Flavobacteriales bacterium]